MSFGLRPKMASTLSLNGNKFAGLIGVDGVPDQKGEETLAHGISVSIQWYSEYEENCGILNVTFGMALFRDRLMNDDVLMGLYLSYRSPSLAEIHVKRTHIA